MKRFLLRGIKVFIDPAAIMYLIGSEMDYLEEVKRVNSSFQIQMLKMFVAVGKVSPFK